ncbi:MAG: hypothetical protein J0M15_14330 [Deltaproteobacteria bacterium]|nr:hypothetical protein [Deltaproteobacteria bacterium]
MGSQCILFYSSKGVNSTELAGRHVEIDLSEVFAQVMDFSSIQKTVEFVKRDDGYIEIRLIGSDWSSLFNYSSEGFNRQGDPRIPLFLFGKELSRKMGVKAIKNPDGSQSLLFPNAKKIKLFIKYVNSKLKGKGIDPITYLPTKFGYATASELIELSLRKHQTFKLHFPFDDNHPDLTPHEISYHLGQILLPKRVTERANAVTTRTLQLISYLESKRSFLGNRVDTISADLLKERSFELDYGTANTMSRIASIIANSPSKNSDAFRVIDIELYSDFFKDSIESLSRSNYLPSFAVVARLVRLLKMPELQELFPNELSSDNSFAMATINSYGKSLSPDLSLLEKKIIKRLIFDFIAKHAEEDKKEGFDLQDPKEVFAELFIGLQQRIDEINEAAEGFDLDRLFKSK